MRRLLLASLAIPLVVLATRASAQLPTCFDLSRQQAAMIADGRGECAVSCKGCGCKGGPGFRNDRTGHCVSYRNLLSECGPAPHDRGCSRECTPVVTGCRRPAVPEQDEAVRHAADKAAERRAARQERTRARDDSAVRATGN